MFSRGITIGGLCLAAAGLASPAAAGGGGQCIEFLNEADFVAYCAQHSKILKGIEDFEESNIAAGGKVPLPAPLQGNVPNVSPANGQGFPNGLTEKNLIIQDNIFPGPNPPAPQPSGDPEALFVIGPGFYNSNSVKIGEDLFLQGIQASLDLIFTDPVHSGIGFQLSRFPDYQLLGWHISVYAMDGTEIGKFIVPPPPGPEPVKSFWGIWCDEPIGRINIWDEADAEPDGIDNIQMWMEQVPVCPWDCGLPHNKMVDVVDFLALLAQWGQVAVPCDFDGGGVSVTDFLILLANWGPCPTPMNDECPGAEFIDKFDPSGTEELHFDMYGATPSPEPYKCLTDLPTHKDTWYCLTNVTGQRIGVTINTNIPLYIEVNDGCVCPPGPLLACGEGPVGTEQFPMDDGQQVLIRLINWLDLPNEELKGSMFIVNKPLIPDQVNFFLDQGLFVEELIAQGKFSKAAWAFKPDFVPIGNPPIPINDVLDINTHPVNAPGVWQDAAGDNMWPPEIDNVQFSSNLTPGGPLTPAGEGGMVYLKPQSVPDIDNNALTEYVLGSFDIISGPPAGDNHTAIAVELVSWDENGVNDPIKWNITVYDKADQPIGNFRYDMQQPLGKQFLGMVTKDPTITIGRVDIWDEVCSYEGISFIELYQPMEPPQVNFFDDPVLFEEAVNEAGKFTKFFWDFNPHNGAPIIPFLIDPLDISTHGINPDDPWTDPGGLNLWPDFVNNVQFTSNLNPQGPLDPGAGMVFLHPGNYPFIQNNALVEAVGQASFDIISGPPAGDNHTAFWLELLSVEGPVPTQLHVSVYDKADVEIGKYVVDYFEGKTFLGILTKGPDITIGRIDIWDPSGGSEGVSIVAPYVRQVPATPASKVPLTIPDPD